MAPVPEPKEDRDGLPAIVTSLYPVFREPLRTTPRHQWWSCTAIFTTLMVLALLLHAPLTAYVVLPAVFLPALATPGKRRRTKRKRRR